MSYTESKLEVRRLASLVKLRLSAEEEKLFSSQLSRILEFFDQLDRASLEGVEPTFHPLEVYNVFREDAVSPFLSDKLLNLPGRVKDRYIWSPRM
ncbi:MAG: Asp-tRNA(Asn)/Glu-tRNA(Gln) amidotransferase subunit GatC [Candidatus Bathyarchaeia archaeon]